MTPRVTPGPRIAPGGASSGGFFMAKKSLLDVLEEFGMEDWAEALLHAHLVDALDDYQVAWRDPVRGVGVSPTHAPIAGRKTCPSQADCINVRCHEDGHCRRTGEIVQEL